ncbi:hypothetical protein CcaverHIS002_0705150 [Cutaneotrichosporon cavernicola]|nr:hypothetical protein CcaverHIS002_0705150 [Cutaneotrichosporon cavernicola]
MAATAASPAGTPPTPPSGLPAFARVTSASLLQRNASTSSSISTTTSESSSSLVAVPIRPPPIQTRTAATPEAQLPSDAGADYSEPEPAGMYGGRGFARNGPRMARQATDPPRSIGTSGRQTPSIITCNTGRSPSVPRNLSPTTPRATRLPLPESMMTGAPHSPQALRVTVADDDGPGTPARPQHTSSSPGTPTTLRGIPKSRNQSMDSSHAALSERERRQSQLSTQSSGSAASRRPSRRDYIFGDELGRGSYSTVVLATAAANGALSASPRGHAQQFAIKIMNQAHLIQEKKAKYAHIERDALIRLSLPRSSMSPTARAGHRRGLSNSSSTGGGPNRKSGPHHLRADSGGGSSAVTMIASPSGGLRDRPLAIADSPTTGTIPLSPLLTSGRLGTRTNEPLEILEDSPRSKPPSPVKEESSDGQSDGGTASEPLQLHPRREGSTDQDSMRMRTPRKRRQSLAPSERSARSSKSVTGGQQVFGHPGIIRLYCTFADKTSVYYVLELASNGELAAVIRRYGSLDLTSTRYYAAQLIDTLEFIHEREIIHRDVKPENLLLDNEMRLKVTDFGSAKILGRKEEPTETSKRSFVGSADYVSPEVLRSEPATFASDIWAFGVVLFDFITGKSPFRSATEFLTFQKVLKRELEFPKGFDPAARSLVELCLDLEASGRPNPQEIKTHPFFAGVDWNNIWSAPAPKITTGMTLPQKTLAQVALDSDVWAAFDDDESDGEFGDHSQEPQYNRFAAAEAVQAVDFPDEELDPPRPAWLEEEVGPRPPRQPKPRGWSTSSSSSGGRLSGLLDTMGINPTFAHRAGSGRVSRTSDRGSYDDRSPSQSRTSSPEARYRGVAHTDNSRWMPLLVANERIVLSTGMSIKPTSAVPLPSFLLPSAKRRQLIMTDLPRLLAVKDDPETGEPRVKTEFQFISHPIPSHMKAVVYNHGGADRDESAIQYVLEVQEKGSKLFVIQTVELCNIHSVGMWFYHRAYPYAISDFQQEQEKIVPEQDEAVAALKAGKRPTTFPFKVIRDVKTDKLIGEIKIFPSQEHPPSEEVWELSYILHPEHQGRGIARAAVHESMEWARAMLGVKKLEAYVQPRNRPSTKLMDKLSFTLLDTITGPWPEEKGGGMSTAARYMKEL